MKARAFLFSILTMFMAALPGEVNAQSNWILEEVTDGSIPAEILPDKRAFATNGLPDGRIATIANMPDVAEAWYSQPTGRYRHQVLGDGVEGGSLKVKAPRGQTYEYRLPSTEVFEDIAPRLIDLDKDGRTEIVTILSSATQGASLAIFSINGNALIKRAQSAFIGQKFRWLNIVGSGNISGSFTPELALVETPHIGGTLRLYKYVSGGLALLISARSFSNHVIGSNELRLSAIVDVDGNGTDDLVVPSADRTDLVVLGFTSDGFKEIDRIILPAPIDKAIAYDGKSKDLELTVGLENGSIYKLHR